MKVSEIMKQHGYVKRANWFGKFLFVHRGELAVAYYPGDLVKPRSVDLAADDWEEFVFPKGAII